MNSNRETALRRLALYATRCGFRCAAEADWPKVIEALTAARENGMPYKRLASARQMYNMLRALDEVKGPPWRYSNDNPLTLIPVAALRQAMESRDWSAVQLSDGRHPEALCEGVFGLASYIRWVTATAEDLLQDTDLPPREWPRPTPQQRVRAMANPKLFSLTQKTLRCRLDYILRHAGFCARELGVDFCVQGLEAVCDPAHVIAHKQARTPDRDAGDNAIGAIAQHLSIVASPYLEAKALQAAERARVQGDLELAAAYVAKADTLCDHANALRALAVQYSTTTQVRTGRAGKHAMAMRIQAIWGLWTADGRSGWHKLGILRDCLIEEVEAYGAQCAGRGLSARMSIEEQILAIDTGGRFEPTQEWALAVRDSVMLTLVQRVPLRSENVAGVTMEEWRNIVAGGEGPAFPWDGAIHLEFEAEKMKGKRGFCPAFLLRQDVADPEVLSMVRPDLLRLYFMPGGAREFLLRVPKVVRRANPEAGMVVSCEYVFPPARAGSLRRGHQAWRKKKPEAWSDDGPTDSFKKALERHHPRLGIDLKALKKIHGATSLHVTRHLFGSHHCDPSRWPDAIGVEQTSKMLHHVSVEFSMEHYCGMTERHVSIRTKAAPEPAKAAASELDKSVLADALKRALEDYLAGKLDAKRYEERRAKILLVA